jgi:hypothetical protein
MFSAFIQSLHLGYRRRNFRAGRTLTRFIAKDVRRDIEIINASEIADGFLTVRIRTWNVLYAIKHIATIPDFSEPRRVKIQDMWHWKGPSCGGPVSPED